MAIVSSGGRDSAKPTRHETVAIGDLRRNLAEFIRKAQQGAELTVTSHGEAVARLVPPELSKPRKMPFGALAGRMKIAQDFDETPADIIAAMEGR